MDAILEEEVLRGSQLSEGTSLVDIRASVRNLTTGNAKETAAVPMDTDVPSLFNGEMLHESGNEADPFGLGMAPLG